MQPCTTRDEGKPPPSPKPSRMSIHQPTSREEVAARPAWTTLWKATCGTPALLAKDQPVFLGAPFWGGCSSPLSREEGGWCWLRCLRWSLGLQEWCKLLGFFRSQVLALGWHSEDKQSRRIPIPLPAAMRRTGSSHPKSHMDQEHPKIAGENLHS